MSHGPGEMTPRNQEQNRCTEQCGPESRPIVPDTPLYRPVPAGHWHNIRPGAWAWRDLPNTYREADR